MNKWNHLVDSNSEPLFDYISALPTADSTVHIVVAWATLSGVELLLSSIGKATVGTVILGVNNQITTFEAVLLLLRYRAKVLLYRDSDLLIFHPKAYYLSSAGGKLDSALLGSSNLTRGGWLDNMELNVHLRGEAAQEIHSYIKELETSAFVTLIDSAESVKSARESGLLGSERRARTQEQQEKAATLTRVKQDRPPIPRIRERRRRRLNDAVREESRRLFTALRTGGFTVYEPTVEDQAVFVMDLGVAEANRLAKVLSERRDAGTFEPNISMSALREHADFWKWPEKYTSNDRSENMEYPVRVRLRTHLTPPEGVETDGRLWVRKRDGRFSEFRFRVGTNDTIRKYLDDTINDDTLLRIDRVIDDWYGVETIRAVDASFSETDALLEQQNRGHRIIYF